MPRHLARLVCTAILTGTLSLPLLIGACGDDDNPTQANETTGSVEGTITFRGTWPATGDVQVSIYSTLIDPPGVPGGPPDVFTDPLDSLTAQPAYHYKLDGIDPGQYAAIFVGWRDPANPSGAKLIGTYWIYPDSVAIAANGLPKEPGPSRVTIHAGDHLTGRNIVADLDLAP